MNWTDACKLMRRGKSVVRLSQTQLDPRANRIRYIGTEPIKMAAAWSDDNKPVFVLIGAQSRCFVIPDESYERATDWVEVP